MKRGVHRDADGFPQAPSQDEWDAMTPAEQARVVALLPGEVTDAELSPPEGDRHFRGKVQAFEAAKREVFRGRDRDGDGGLDETELSVNAAHDFVVTDRDRNGSLDPGEFAAGYPILAVIARVLR